jgi:hypothetical protein
MYTGKESFEFRQHVGPSDDNVLDIFRVSTLDKLILLGCARLPEFPEDIPVPII